MKDYTKRARFIAPFRFFDNGNLSGCAMRPLLHPLG